MNNKKIDIYKELDNKNHSIKYGTMEIETKLQEVLKYIESGKKGVKHIYNIVSEALTDIPVVEKNQKDIENMVYELIEEEKGRA